MWARDIALSEEPEGLYCPPLDRRKGYAHYDEPILDWYGGLFDLVYVTLHPFAWVEGWDPSCIRHGTTIIKRWELPPDVHMKEVLESAGERSALGADERHRALAAMKSQGVGISWTEVAQRTGFADVKAVNRALLTTVASLRP